MLSREQSRNADRFAIKELGIPGIVLMENAGRGCAETLLALGGGSGVVICCGGGNNGGDGFVIARHLFNAGIDVKIVLFSSPERYQADAAVNLHIVERLPIQIVLFEPDWTEEAMEAQLGFQGRESAAWIVDAVLGTGATGRLRPPLDRAVTVMNRLPVKRLAVDIPTGMDCDTGAVGAVAFRADVTCTFIDRKLGFGNRAAAPFLGHVQVVDIGINRDQIVGR